MTQVRVLLPVLALVFVLLVTAAPARAGAPAYAKGDMVLGAKDAPVTVIEYASMTCPHCANFHMGTFKELKAKYIDTGKVRMIFREVPFDPLALQASMLARCAGEKRYFGMLNVLFKNQMKWAKAANPQQALGNIARLGGFTEARFKACMMDQVLADMILQTRLDGNEKYKVDSTPSFIVNGVKTSGNMTIDRWDELLARYLK
ncbi:MAG: DsbA family protein [Alphaproteobacteria bacterium]|nr:DsbA family protein [Alphaproteobacteria bacterium]